MCSFVVRDFTNYKAGDTSHSLEAYWLNVADIQEVETWYKRRYPKLPKAQEENLKKVKEGKK